MGLVSVGMLRYLPREAWTTTPLRNVVRKAPTMAWQDEHVEDVLQRMRERAGTFRFRPSGPGQGVWSLAWLYLEPRNPRVDQ